LRALIPEAGDERPIGAVAVDPGVVPRSPSAHLGQGLGGSEIEELREDHALPRIRSIPVGEITPNRNQPRSRIRPEDLAELADSIRENGLIEPVIVRPSGDQFELVAGERRWRACVLAGWKEIPAVVRSMGTETSLEIALVENIQRSDLNPVEEARAYQRLATEFGRTHEEIARKVGKDRSTVANLLRILRLPEAVLERVSRETLTVGHARALLSLGEAEQLEMARQAELHAWSVREVEERVARALGGADSGKRGRAARRGLKKPEHIIRLEDELCRHFGAETKVRLQRRGGRLEIRFHDEEELSRLLDLLGVVVR